MKTFLSQLQTDIYNTLKNNTHLMNRINGVYDYVINENYPYVTIGEDTSIPYNCKTFEGEEVTVTLHVWSQKKGKKECKEIIGLVINAMNSLSSDYFTIDTLRVNFIQILDDPDGLTKHGVVKFRLKIKEV